jgi:hypothetical protein
MTKILLGQQKKALRGKRMPFAQNAVIDAHAA